MNRFVTLAAVTVVTATLVACGGSTPTSPSTLAGPTAAAAPAVDGDSSTNGGSRWTTRALLSDSDFITLASSFHQGQISVGIVAETRVAHPGVKLFARQMISEGREELRRLRRVATVPSGTPAISATNQQLMADLLRTSGNPADRLYVQAMVTELQATLAVYQEQVGDIPTTNAYRAYANEWAIKLRVYVEDIVELAARVR